jgi:hypothetical protein
MWHRPAIFVQDSSAHNDALPERFTGMLPGKIAGFHVNVGGVEQRTSHFGKRMRKIDERLRSRAFNRGEVSRVQMQGLRTRGWPPVAGKCNCTFAFFGVSLGVKENDLLKTK